VLDKELNELQDDLDRLSADGGR